MAPDSFLPKYSPLAITPKNADPLLYSFWPCQLGGCLRMRFPGVMTCLLGV